MKAIYFVFLVVLLGCNKNNDVIQNTNAKAVNETSAANGTLSATSTYQILSFSVVKGGFIKWGGCFYASVIIDWTATGETNIKGYDIEKSTSTTFSNSNIEPNILSSNNDLAVSRSVTNASYTNGRYVTYYFRLKIYNSDASISYGPVASALLKSNKCAPGF